MNKAILLLFFCSLFITGASPQTKTDYSHPDAVARAAPDSAGKSILSLSGYFNSNLHSGRELIRAFYYWTANNIVYDVRNMFTFRSDDDPAKIISRTLLERKAVCQGYSGVFHELCKNAGIESYIVLGYTKQNGRVVSVNHAWVLARIDTGWYFFDPTWGSGFLTEGRFIRKFTNEYFMVPPALFITSHMPFDPLWQCLNFPLNSRNFNDGIFPRTDTCSYFSFGDSIAAYGQLSLAEQYSATFRRVAGNGVTNGSLYEYQRYLQQNMEVERINRQNDIQNEMVIRFNDAVAHYNKASLLFNDYIVYWNHQFKPAKPDDVIRKMLDTCGYHLALAGSILSEIAPREENLMQNKEILLKAVHENQRHVDEQNLFLKDYFSTSRALRPSLFTKYTWLGTGGK
ncbi:MAG: transglutaminase domain-containing protein [Bacteroidota bacterium]